MSMPAIDTSGLDHALHPHSRRRTVRELGLQDMGLTMGDGLGSRTYAHVPLNPLAQLHMLLEERLHALLRVPGLHMMELSVYLRLWRCLEELMEWVIDIFLKSYICLWVI